MPMFIMLCGLPASGKSTYAEDIKNKYGNVVICSSDAIREELTGDINNQDLNEEVFKVLHRRIKDNLKAGNNVIYDACNISSRRRKHFVQTELKGIKCTKICFVFATDYEFCLKNNLKRDRQVPEEVIKRMYMNWETPYYFEGWEQIHVHRHTNMIDGLMEHRLQKTVDFNQHNSHHRFTLWEHMIRAWKYIKNDDTEVSFENADLRWAALYHDCGKVFTQVFHNAKGEPTEEAHYYNHENVGAYDCLCDYSKTLLTSVLINLHMKPYTWKLEKTKQKYKKLWGEQLYNMIMLLHKADVDSH